MRNVATSLQLLSNVDQQTVLKAGSWMSGDFILFYLQDFCPQSDRLHKAGPLVVGRRVVVVTSTS